ncbi:DUF2845 domain-containing protein [Thermodesulfobacteriota bacterium]
MKKVLLLKLVLVCFCSFFIPAHAQGITFKCGSLSVDTGVNSAVVEAQCGEPMKKEELGMTERKTTLEKWYYGPMGGYYYILSISAGRVVKIERVR